MVMLRDEVGLKFDNLADLPTNVIRGIRGYFELLKDYIAAEKFASASPFQDVFMIMTMNERQLRELREQTIPQESGHQSAAGGGAQAAGKRAAQDRSGDQARIRSRVSARAGSAKV